MPVAIGCAIKLPLAGGTSVVAPDGADGTFDVSPNGAGGKFDVGPDGACGRYDVAADGAGADGTFDVAPGGARGKFDVGPDGACGRFDVATDGAGADGTFDVGPDGACDRYDVATDRGGKCDVAPGFPCVGVIATAGADNDAWREDAFNEKMRLTVVVEEPGKVTMPGRRWDGSTTAVRVGSGSALEARCFLLKRGGWLRPSSRASHREK